MNYRLPSCCVSFTLGCAWLQTQAQLPGAAPLTLGLVSALVLLLGLCRWSSGVSTTLRNATGAGLMIVAAASLGASYAGLRAQARLGDALSPEHENQLRLLTVRVAELPITFERGLRFEAEALAAPAGVPQRLMLSWYATERRGVPDVRVGQVWQVSARLRRPHGTLNFDGFDVEAWLLQQGVRATGVIQDAETAPTRTNCWANWRLPFECARQRLRERLMAALQGLPYAGVVLALVIGDQSFISPAQWTVFNISGIGHLVSISGLHITLLAGLFAAAVDKSWRRLRLGRFRAAEWQAAPSVAAIAACLSALLYSLLAGWAVPARRTFWMLWTIVALRCLNRPLAPAYVLAVALAVVVAVDPWAPLSPGFWLSFTAVALIFFVSSGRVDLTQYRKSATSTATKLRHVMHEGARIQAVITFGLAPLTVVLFQQISLIGPIANAVAIPVVSFIVTPLALLGAATITTPLGPPLLWLAQAVIAKLMQFINPLAQWTGALWTLPAAPVWMAAWASLGLLWMWGPPRWPARWVAWTLCLPLLTYRPPMPPAGGWRLTALDVGQGSALLFETGNKRLLFDTGPRIGTQSDAGERVVVPYLRAQSIRQLDALVVSHEDADHAGGVEAVLRAVPTGTMWSSGGEYLASVTGVDDSPQQRQLCRNAVEWRWQGWRLRFLQPTAEQANHASSRNARSCVLLIEPDLQSIKQHETAPLHVGTPSGMGAILLTGDIEAAQERLLVADGLTPVDILAVPHHGSRTSSSASFIAATQPRVALMQLGHLNRYRHPAREVQARWESSGARVYRSDRDGAVQISYVPGNPGALKVVNARDLRRRYWHDA